MSRSDLEISFIKPKNQRVIAVSIGDELHPLERIVSAHHDLAEDCVRRRIPMAMDDWAAIETRFCSVYLRVA